MKRNLFLISQAPFHIFFWLKPTYAILFIEYKFLKFAYKWKLNNSFETNWNDLTFQKVHHIFFSFSFSVFFDILSFSDDVSVPLHSLVYTFTRINSAAIQRNRLSFDVSLSIKLEFGVQNSYWTLTICLNGIRLEFFCIRFDTVWRLHLINLSPEIWIKFMKRILKSEIVQIFGLNFFQRRRKRMHKQNLLFSVPLNKIVYSSILQPK